MIKLKRVIAIVVMMLLAISLLVGCTEAERVSTNLSQEADNFNVTRQLTVINTRAEDGNNAVLFQMTGNFSINKEADGDLAVIGEEPDGTYYKHFVYLTRDISYIVQQVETRSVSKYKFTINYNPKMIIPVDTKIID